jgi:hypothetical protein
MKLLLLLLLLAGQWVEHTQWTQQGRVAPATVYDYTCPNGTVYATIMRDWKFDAFDLDHPGFRRVPYRVYVMGSMVGRYHRPH